MHKANQNKPDPKKNRRYILIISLIILSTLSCVIDTNLWGTIDRLNQVYEDSSPDKELGDPGASGVYGSDSDDSTASSQSGDVCVDFTSETNVTSFYAMEEGDPPDIRVAANAAEQAPPVGFEISFGGVATGYGSGMILWQAGDWVEITTADSYQAVGVQVHGDQTIGWARVLFDGEEIWSGDTSSHNIAEGRFGVYVEVRCFPPGTHSLRIEGLGIEGSGGGRSIPVSYFGIRE